MANNREILAENISKRFVDAISGTNNEQVLIHNPEDRIYVGKLSPQSKEEDFSSSVLIKQISVDFRIPKTDVDKAELHIYPQGNFFFRVIPTYEQQCDYFVKDFNSAFKTDYKTFKEFAEASNTGKLSTEMMGHKVQLLPVYEKIAIDRNGISFLVKVSDFYNKQYECGNIPQDHEFYNRIQKDVEAISNELAACENIIPCQFRDKLTIGDLLTEEEWEIYKKKQIAREEFPMFVRFNYSLTVDFKGVDECINVTVALSNETQWGDENEAKGSEKGKSNNKYRINTLFNSGIKVKCTDTTFCPIELEYFADDYKYDKNVYALGNNCNVEYNEAKAEIQTTHVPKFIQHRLKTREDLAVKFDDLISNPVNTLAQIHTKMLVELEAWKSDYNQGINQATGQPLTEIGKAQFKKEIEGFATEIKRFKTGIELIKNHNMIKQAFCYMNQAFKNSAKGYSAWRLFQIVFIVSLILDVVAHEADLMLDDDIIAKAKTDDIDILYFPTGGGKTEAFLGILIFNLFFDRIRGKECGVTAMLKYPLRLLSVQQVQRVSNILASAELIRREYIAEGEVFSLGYFVGDHNTPNSINKEKKQALSEMSMDELDEKYKLLDVCPYCGNRSVHILYDGDKNSLLHICDNKSCLSGGALPLYMVDEDVYRFLPSVIISTVDKMTAIGFNSRFHNILCGAEFKCPKHGYTDKLRCLAEGCDCDISEYQHIKMKDPAPTLLIQDELHLIKESLGTYAGHYETLFEYFIKHLSQCNRGIKVIGATATISAYAEQAKHLYWKNSIRFPAASPYLDHNFYSKIDNNDICRIILGYAPFGKAIVNSVAYSLQYLKRVVWELYQDPKQILLFEGIVLEGDENEKVAQAKKLLDEYWIILEYNNVKMESNRVLQALEDPINTELNEEGIEPLTARKMTGDDSFQEVRATLSDIEHAEDIVEDIDFNMIAATSMISHGVDADRFNLMVFYGIPGNTAEYIQAYSRVGRKHTGVVIDIIRPSREKDRSYLKNFQKFHEYKDILVDAVSINRWATKAVEITLPGVVSSLLLNYYLYELKYETGVQDISKFSNLQTAVLSGKITEDMIQKHCYNVFKCSTEDSSVGKLYRQIIDQQIKLLFEKIRTNSFEAKTYLTEVFDKCNFHVMRSLRDTDKQIIVEMR